MTPPAPVYIITPEQDQKIISAPQDDLSHEPAANTRGTSHVEIRLRRSIRRGAFYDPAWSPDGMKLVYVSNEYRAIREAVRDERKKGKGLKVI